MELPDQRWTRTIRAWAPALVPTATLGALVLAYLLLKWMIEAGGPIDVAAEYRRELAKIAWAAIQLVVYAALGWHISLHAIFLAGETHELSRGLTRALWATVAFIGAASAFHFFRSPGAVGLVNEMLNTTEKGISGVRNALDIGNTLATVAVALIAAWAFALLRPRSGPEQGSGAAAALARRYLLSLNSSAALLVVAIAQIWILNLVAVEMAQPQAEASGYRAAANGIALAAGVCFSVLLVLLYLPLLAMLRHRGLIDPAEVSGSVVTTAKAVGPTLLPALSGLLAGIQWLIPGSP